ncbi:hypothetical protein B0H14DRAFT_3129257 [Mycena olivaceomarginata]|nr:hypothetical protein B0H14DRAFT_3129257 [Mycena olivaceomarginata]
MGRWTNYEEVRLRPGLSLSSSQVPTSDPPSTTNASPAINTDPQDTDRLPEGIQRTGYDDQTARYQFRDPRREHLPRPPTRGVRGPHAGRPRQPRAEPQCDHQRPAWGVRVRWVHPQCRDATRLNQQRQKKPPPERTGSTGSTFRELLPAHLVTSSSASESALAGSKNKNSRFRNVANTARRSTTFVRKLRGSGPRQDARFFRGETAGHDFCASGGDRVKETRGDKALIRRCV